MSAEPKTNAEAELIERARFGDSAAFNKLIEPHLPRIRGLVRRLIGHPEDCRDLVQDTLLRAYEKISGFRGDAKLSTWLHTIATRVCLDHLRAKQRWRGDVQVHVRSELHGSARREAEVLELLQAPELSFDVHEHIAFCFTCVARSLEPDEQLALVLRDVLALSNKEAARVLGVSESVLRHRLSAGRRAMQARFEGLCALVSKSGACWQCEGLRESFGEDRRGPALPTLVQGPSDEAEGGYRRRLKIVRDADIEAGRTQSFHDFVWRAIERLEQARAV